MSAIWGMVDLNATHANKYILVQTQAAMEQPLHERKIDSFDKIVQNDFVMGCGMQYFTEESHYEIMPIWDEKRQIAFTADVFLDNRQELLEMVEEKYLLTSMDKCGDGTLLYALYLQYGEAFVKKVRGAFSIAIYCQKENKFLLYADPVFERCIYYYKSQGKIFFGTLLESIKGGMLAANKEKPQVNLEFLSDTLSINGLRGFVGPEYTPYEGINKVVAGTFLTMKVDETSVARYFTIGKMGLAPKYKNPTESGQICKEISNKAVKEYTRVGGKTGATLSSGLDSSTISGVAAVYLKEQKKKLNTYTFVPVKDYVYQGVPYWQPDETKGVEQICKMHSNIVPHFISDEEKNAYNTQDEFLKMFETPYKSLQNMPYFYQCFADAAKDGCKLVLTGQYGNVTFSLGEFQNAVYSFAKKGHLVKAYKVLKGFCRRNHIGRKRVLKQLIHNYRQDKKREKEEQKNKRQNYLDTSYVNKDFSERMHSMDRISGEGLLKNNSWLSIDDYHYYVYDPAVLSMIGENMTKVGLSQGILVRDMSKDVRMMELCYSLPMDCFFRDGLSRWLIRGNMQEYVPEEILYNMKSRGLQSADDMFKLNQNWSNIYPKLCNDCMSEELAPYIDREKVRQKLEQMRQGVSDENKVDTLLILYLANISKFLQMC